MKDAFILTTLAGLATMLGIIPIFIKTKKESSIISSSCAFAGGVMICVSILDLIPSSIKYLQSNYSNPLILLLVAITLLSGVYISYYMDHLIDKTTTNSSNLFKVGLLSMIAIIMHNIPEGIVTFIVSNKNIFLGISLCIAISLHNIPEGISIAVPIYYSTKSKFKAILYTLISAMSEPFGAILSYLFLEKYITNNLLGLLFSFIAGIMIQISINKLLPTSSNYNQKTSIIFFIIGFIFMTISLLLNSLIS